MKKNGLISGSTLKLIAVITMVIDHTAAYLLTDNPLFTGTLFSVFNTEISWITLMRGIGRLSFPLFSFLLVEGFLHTRDRIKYGLYLLVFAFLSEIPWDLINHDTWFCLKSQNIFFSLWLGYLCLCILKSWVNDKLNLILGLIILFCISFLFRVDYGVSGVIFITLLYILRQWSYLCFLPAIIFLPMGWFAACAGVPAGLYNGQRGFINNNTFKFLFYFFYPVHLLLFVWLFK